MLRQYFRQFALRHGDNYEKIPDEETPSGPPSPVTEQQTFKTKISHLRRPSKTLITLLLIDFTILFALICILQPLISLLLHNQELFGTHIDLSQAEQSSPGKGEGPQIPRIFHQTCKNETIPPMWAEAQASCLDTYSDYEYKLWTDESARQFLSEEYPWFVETWDNYPFPIQRADAIRYFVLYHYGGIYLDMDTVCHDPFPMDKIEDYSLDHVALFEATKPTGITNDIMISSARHPAFESGIHRLPGFQRFTSYFAPFQPYAAIMMATGPLFITLATAQYLYGEVELPSPTVKVIKPADLKPFISDLQTATWHKADAKVLLWLANKPFVWFFLGGVGFVIGVCILNMLMLLAWRGASRGFRCVASSALATMRRHA